MCIHWQNGINQVRLHRRRGAITHLPISVLKLAVLILSARSLVYTIPSDIRPLSLATALPAPCVPTHPEGELTDRQIMRRKPPYSSVVRQWQICPTSCQYLGGSGQSVPKIGLLTQNARAKAAFCQMACLVRTPHEHGVMVVAQDHQAGLAGAQDDDFVLLGAIGDGGRPAEQMLDGDAHRSARIARRLPPHGWVSSSRSPRSVRAE